MVDAVVDALSSDVGNPLEAFSLLLQCFTTTMLLFFSYFFLGDLYIPDSHPH